MLHELFIPHCTNSTSIMNPLHSLFKYENTFHLITLLVCRLLLLFFYKLTYPSQVKTNTHFKYYKSLFPVLFQLT